ncbi:uncharacterized protein LOC129224170 [Uloborus diversus]|uniref:uncharacterized protein LOC129224170 n=1 Tax=Uloborus diversus TaxID=327109 RepID=UPI0024091D0E|nr:uncharacterized protein LOC129224170 [Uloborus diversus]
MGLKIVPFILMVVLACGVIADDRQVLNCVKEKFNAGLPEQYAQCQQSSEFTEVSRVKQCYGRTMEAVGVYAKDSSNKMKVDREKFGKYARENSGPVAHAMGQCYNTTRADDEMYKKPARVNQCVFLKVKQTCQRSR